MKNKFVLQVASVWLWLWLVFSLHAQIDSPQKHYAYAVDLMENQVFELAKVAFVEIIHLYEHNEYQDDARYHLGEIALKEGQLGVALRQWERLRDKYPQSQYVENVALKIAIISELLAKEDEIEIEDLSVKILFDNAEFFLEKSPILTINVPSLKGGSLALEWYKKVVEKYPESLYAPKALYAQILVHKGWGKSTSEGFGLSYYLSYYKGSPKKMLINKTLEEMTSLLKELEEKYPQSKLIVKANFIMGQAHEKVVSWSFEGDPLVEAKKAMKYYQRVIDLTKDDDFSIYRQIAPMNLEKLAEYVRNTEGESQ